MIDPIVNRQSLLASFFVFIVAFTLYLITLAPTITWAHHGADGGDLITAAYTLGVAHPPGYPTYVTLGHIFAQLPLGDVAYRLNLMSAVCMAFTVALTTLGIRRVTLAPSPSLADGKISTGEGRTGVGLIGGLVFAAAPMVWGQATIAEVHALNALFVAAIVCLLAPAIFHSESILASRMIIVVFIWGLGLGNLPTIILLAPLLFIAGYRSLITDHSSLITRYSSLVIAFLLGLGIYLLVPIRAAAHPPINWGNAITLENFLALVTAQLYRGYAFALPLTEYPSRLIAFAQLLVAQFGWPGVLVGIIGIYRALVKPTKAFFAIAMVIALYIIFALGYNTVDSDLYLIPVWLFFAWAIARGSIAMIDWARTHIRQHSGSLILAVLLISLIVNVIINFASMDLRSVRTAENFAQRVLTQAPASAIVVTRDDTHTFALWYYRHVENRRPDAAIVDARLLDEAWYDQMLHDQGNAPVVPDIDPETTWLSRLKASNPLRPVCEIDALTADITCN